MPETAEAPETKVKTKPTFYARIPPQDFNTMPPRKAGQVRILGQTFVAGGKWKGPWVEKKANILRLHQKRGCAPTFQVLPTEKVKRLVAAPGGPLSREETAKRLRKLQEELTKLQGVVDVQEAEEQAETEEEVLAEATAEMGGATEETIPGTDTVPEDDDKSESGAASLNLDDEGTGDSPASEEEKADEEPAIEELNLAPEDAGPTASPSSDPDESRSGTAAVEVGGRKRKFATPDQHAASGSKTSPPKRGKRR